MRNHAIHIYLALQVQVSVQLHNWHEGVSVTHVRLSALETPCRGAFDLLVRVLLICRALLRVLLMITSIVFQVCTNAFRGCQPYVIQLQSVMVHSVMNWTIDMPQSIVRLSGLRVASPSIRTEHSAITIT